MSDTQNSHAPEVLREAGMPTPESTSGKVSGKETLIDVDAAETEESLSSYTEKDSTNSSPLGSSAPSPGVQEIESRSCSLSDEVLDDH